MAKNYTTEFIRNANSTSAKEAALTALEISHADLTDPIRVVIDNQDLPHNGETFVAISAEVTWPDDKAQGQPRANITVDNVGRVMTDWIESSNGGENASYRFMHILRSDPDTVQAETTLSASNVSMSWTDVTATLGYEDILNLPAVALNFTAVSAPGLV